MTNTQRQPDSNVQVFKLGHWEVMQFALGLLYVAGERREFDRGLAEGESLPDNHPWAKLDADHLEALANIFATGEALFTIIKEFPEE